MQNLMGAHPEGLGKHIRVFDYTNPTNLLTEQQILDTYIQYEIPYFIQEKIYPHRKFLVVLGSDITCGCDWFWDKCVSQDGRLLKVPNLGDVAAALNQLSFYTNQVHAHLNQHLENVKILLIGAPFDA